ncbi:hypothetical protein NCCP2222_31140 [Sporosarcina sp. NCCP-2222]|uniref:hypothetical protein n=1 Tax=Sporosarcina sp. NCCP-2222 TaxID=2935073 RepID=UPI00208721E2|nr:hypothetical protein [Sporosarcina sp. NCCP-2222]GKV57167.1 hypothetical protein NCCP2222_31140 [Sporosarcina sp. NCCP-2222]
MLIFLMPILALIIFGLLFDWRRKRNSNIHRENIDAKPEVSSKYTMEGDRNSPQGYL